MEICGTLDEDFYLASCFQSYYYGAFAKVGVEMRVLPDASILEKAHRQCLEIGGQLGRKVDELLSIKLRQDSQIFTNS